MKTTPKIPRTIADIKADPRVTDFSDERGSHDGVWAYLVAGYQSSMGTHQIAEDTVKEACEQFRYIKPCACDDCKREKGTDEALSMTQKAAKRAHQVAAPVVDRCPDPSCASPMGPWSTIGERECSNPKCPGEVSEYSAERDQRPTEAR